MDLGLQGKVAIVTGATANIGRDEAARARIVELARERGAKAATDADKAMRQRNTLVGKPFATPEEMSGIVAYLASDRASFVTGQVWSVDGGSLL